MTDTTHTNLAGALAAVQASLPEVRKGETAIVPTKAGGSYKYSYADLADVTRAILPVLGQHGLAWLTKPTIIDGRFVLEYKLLHSSGEVESGVYSLPDRGSPQEIGSAITYARRYALCSVTGVAPDDDDDAAEATAGHQRDQQQSGRGYPESSGGDSWESARPASAPPAVPRQRTGEEARPAPAAPAPNSVRDWTLASDRTAGAVRQAAVKLLREHPDVASAMVVNEHGDDEQLRMLMDRRARELSPTPVEPAPEVEPDASALERRRKRLFALFNDVGYGGDANREKRHEIAGSVLKREVTSMKDVTAGADVERLISALEERQRQQPVGAPA